MAGFLVIVIEAPCCCLFIDFVQNISDWVEKRPYWNRAAFYVAGSRQDMAAMASPPATTPQADHHTTLMEDPDGLSRRNAHQRSSFYIALSVVSSLDQHAVFTGQQRSTFQFYRAPRVRQ
uniref:Calcium channel flower n=1 Tax=Timema bartmani TaxID=61472 RepID=A0A7R9HYL1_9NEOP|nr:unnamed protein product [Timema bartmani]